MIFSFFLFVKPFDINCEIDCYYLNQNQYIQPNGLCCFISNCFFSSLRSSECSVIYYSNSNGEILLIYNIIFNCSSGNNKGQVHLISLINKIQKCCFSYCYSPLYYQSLFCSSSNGLSELIDSTISFCAPSDKSSGLITCRFMYGDHYFIQNNISNNYVTYYSLPESDYSKRLFLSFNNFFKGIGKGMGFYSYQATDIQYFNNTNVINITSTDTYGIIGVYSINLLIDNCIFHSNQNILFFRYLNSGSFSIKNSFINHDINLIGLYNNIYNNTNFKINTFYFQFYSTFHCLNNFIFSKNGMNYKYKIFFCLLIGFII